MILFIKHAKAEGPGTLGDFFRESSWQVKIVELCDNEALPPVENCEAIISLGGPMNVYETKKYPFLKKEEAFIKKALKKKIPILGICLGAQLLAKASAAKIVKSENKEIGWYSVTLTSQGKTDSLFKGLNQKMDVFQWHEDSFCIPKESALLATADTCKNQAVRVGKNAWGLQFHPEMTEEMISGWFSSYPKEQKDKMLLTYFQKKDVYDKQARLMYLNFSKAIVA